MLECLIQPVPPLADAGSRPLSSVLNLDCRGRQNRQHTVQFTDSCVIMTLLSWSDQSDGLIIQEFLNWCKTFVLFK